MPKDIRFTSFKMLQQELSESNIHQDLEPPTPTACADFDTFFFKFYFVYDFRDQ